jgi:tetratricopeptide (TPR) repeat protein
MVMTRRIVSSVIAIFILCGAGSFAMQDKISPLSDYQYKKDYARYEEIKKEADLQKRADLLMAFIKERPISKILLYVTTDIQETIKPSIDKKEWPKAIASIEALLAILPTEQTVKAAVDAGDIPVGGDEFLKQQLEPARMGLQRTLMAAYYGSGNLPKAAEIAEKIYAAAPDLAGLKLLAQIYQGMQNTDKYLEYLQKIMASVPMDQPDGYGTALQIAQIYIQKQNVPAATEMLSKVMDVYGDKVPPNVQEAQWNATRAFAYGVIAAGIYQKKDYAKAIELYEKVAKFDPKRDDAYYYIGMSKWQTEGQDAAMEPFAKCVVLNKTMAPRAKQYLEQIYKGKHQDSLAGIEEILNKAKADLGIS